MLTIVYCTRTTNPEYSEILKTTSGLRDKVEVIELVTNGGSLTTQYNKGLKLAKNNIVVFCHDDLEFITKNWGNKLLKLFSKHPDFGIIGIAGTRELPTSGKWWENPRAMRGRVEHEHNGKRWLSSYSEDIDNNLDPVVICDGLFFAIDKTKTKAAFNEDYTGFHFYDVTYCLDNHLAGVKIGVTTAIRVCHKSMGVTNDEWEKNRVKFSEEYKSQLPQSTKVVIHPGKKLKVLIGCLSFTSLTGSELYVYELAKGLQKQGCDVTICSRIGNPLKQMATKLNINLVDIKEPPGYKLGDGKWQIKTPQGQFTPSKENTLYKVQPINFDVVIVNHKPVGGLFTKIYSDIPMINIVHSEIIDLEEPVITPQIKEYIAIRPEIAEHIEKVGVFDKPIKVIYNPIDQTKFKPKPIPADLNTVLFVGTIDYLRKETILDLVDYTKNSNKKLIVVGAPHMNYMEEIVATNPHVQYYPPTTNIQDYIYQASETAGILLGRTTIESWMCGRPAWIYNIDRDGLIIDKKLHEVPNDIEKYYSDNVAKHIYNELIEIIN